MKRSKVKSGKVGGSGKWATDGYDGMTMVGIGSLVLSLSLWFFSVRIGSLVVSLWFFSVC